MHEQDRPRSAWLDHYEDPFHRGSCNRATHRAERYFSGCGDLLVMELEVVDGVVSEAWFDGEGCQLSQGAASMLAERAEGQSVGELRAFSAEQMLSFVDPTLDASKQGCCLLAHETLLAALDSPLDDDNRLFAGPDLGAEC